MPRPFVRIAVAAGFALALAAAPLSASAAEEVEPDTLTMEIRVTVPAREPVMTSGAAPASVRARVVAEPAAAVVETVTQLDAAPPTLAVPPLGGPSEAAPSPSPEAAGAWPVILFAAGGVLVVGAAATCGIVLARRPV